MIRSLFDRESFGKLFIRVILGTILAAKGVMFFVQGDSALISLGKILSTIGITKLPLYFGWAIAIVCVVCGVTFAIGAFFKMSTFLLGTIFLLNAIFMYCGGRDLVDEVSHVAILSAVMYGFMFIGAGAHAVQK
ncbi:MAG: hypothetical protein LBT64_03005 [Puniceicoccales bacterium]|jgi:uncharacterized membrane protein YphA (DoxX/SURF4 family)|nr:hypothetical protein [Puniceicoccales bacterium]